MQVEEIVVTSGRAVSNPYSQYENFKPSISIKATVGTNDNIEIVTKFLQQKAEKMLDEHQKLIFNNIKARRNKPAGQATLRADKPAANVNSQTANIAVDEPDWGEDELAPPVEKTVATVRR